MRSKILILFALLTASCASHQGEPNVSEGSNKPPQKESNAQQKTEGVKNKGSDTEGVTDIDKSKKVDESGKTAPTTPQKPPIDQGTPITKLQGEEGTEVKPIIKKVGSGKGGKKPKTPQEDFTKKTLELMR